MGAIPASTPEFYRTVRELLVSYNSRLRDEDSPKDQVPLPVVPALTPIYSKLSPGAEAAHLIVMTSPWIDLCSPDPVIAELSRQVFNLEIAYAAFCGVRNVLVPGPNLTHGEMCVEGFSRFARAMQEALVLSNYINFQVLLPMAPGSLRNTSVLRTKMENLSIFADSRVKHRPADDMWGSWEAWNLTRTVCDCNMRLSVGKVVISS
jgi:type II protein arginine methyltransferase